MREVITIIDGGLGSQMSQFAMGHEIKRITGNPVSYDLSWYSHCGKDINGKENRKFELEDVFPNVKVNKSSYMKSFIYRKLYNKNRTNTILDLDKINLSKPPVYLGGYWTSDKYTNYNMDEYRKLFSFNLTLNEENKNMLEKIKKSPCPAAVQIRMGDYSGSVLDVVTPKYFLNSINYIKEKIKTDAQFFVFSTEPDKCKTFLPLTENITFVNINDNDKGAFDMYLMMHCSHFIISNSTFGFWPSLLSSRCPDKIVVQPNKWNKNDKKIIKPKYSGWISIDC